MIIDSAALHVYDAAMNNFSIRKDDQDAVMQAIGPMVLILLREAVDEGFQ
jgi:hypothetical protein